MLTIYAYERARAGNGASAQAAAASPAAPPGAHAHGCFRKDVPLEELPALLLREDVYLWVDMHAPTDDETAILESVFHFHPLSIEDCIFDHPNPKIDEYPDYLYMVMHGMRVLGEKPVDAGTFNLKMRELDVFLGARYLLTFHHEDMRSIQQTKALLEKNPEHMGRGPSVLLHYVLDYLVDHYIPVMDELDARIDELEKAVAGPGADQVVTQVFLLRQHVNSIRRLAARQREVLARISRREFPLIDAAAALYFRDIFDHVVRVNDQAESYRELLSSLVEIALARTSNRLNNIMKTLTLVNTIFLPLTFVTGIYGMNFEVLPGKSHALGFWICLGGMAAAAITMLVLYRKKKWL